jgi:hypothetical protein
MIAAAVNVHALFLVFVVVAVYILGVLQGRYAK